MPGTKEYNKVYEKLVQSDKDYVGMLAYSIYKKQKQEFIKEHIINNGGDIPCVEKIKSFHDLAIQPTQIDMYRKQATSLTKELTNEIISTKKSDIKDFIDNNLKNKGFWPYMLGVSQSLIANIIWLILIAIVAVILWSMEHGPFETIKSICQIKTT